MVTIVIALTDRSVANDMLQSDGSGFPRLLLGIDADPTLPGEALQAAARMCYGLVIPTGLSSCSYRYPT